ncbi:MAG: hypothetical protein ACLVLH_04580 [Eisenbergiella massiliensis]
MLNMLRMDLRRMFRSRMFYIAFLCLTAGILIMIIMLHTITDRSFVSRRLTRE